MVALNGEQLSSAAHHWDRPRMPFGRVGTGANARRLNGRYEFAADETAALFWLSN